MPASEPELLNDEEFRDLLRISESTFYRLLADGPPKTKQGEGDIRTIKHARVGGARRWLRSSVMAFIRGETTPPQKEN